MEKVTQLEEFEAQRACLFSSFSAAFQFSAGFSALGWETGIDQAGKDLCPAKGLDNWGQGKCVCLSHAQIVGLGGYRR